MTRDTNLIYTGEDLKDNWFYNRYYYSNANSRYHSFQIVLNMLNQLHEQPTIVETGCQRLEEDLGGGMSTAIFAEYISRYGGKLISVDINPNSVSEGRKVLQKYSNVDAEILLYDSVGFLSGYHGECDLLYLDSYDYPYGEILNQYGGQTDIEEAMKTVRELSRDEILDRHMNIIRDCQEHCLNEYKAIEHKLSKRCILLIDDNQLAGGGKPRLLKDYLSNQDEWICLYDFQSSLWIREL